MSFSRIATVLAIAAGLGVACAAGAPAPVRTATATSAVPIAASTAPHEMTSASAPEIAVSAEPSASEDPIATVAPKPVCNPQQAFEFLVRKNYIPVKEKKQAHEKALKYKTTHYGFVKNFGDKSWNPTAAKDHVVETTLFGLTVKVHEKIVPALACAEAEVKATCAATPYTPKVLAGIRDRNTFRAGEVTNHLYGIAVDIDPLENSCCGCTKKWQASPLCKKKTKSIWERMSMPKCWVDAFEKYGFYWLGHDKLQDTMHFEFLADPDKIMVTPASSAIAAAATP